MNDNQAQSIRAAVILEDSDNGANKHAASEISAAVFEVPQAQSLEQDFLADEDINAPVTGVPENKTVSRKWFWLGLGVLGLATAELVSFINRVFSNQDWLGGLWLVVLAVGGVIAVKELLREWRSLRQLKSRTKHKVTASDLLNGPSIGQAETFCQQIAKPLSRQYSLQITQWQQTLQPHYVDGEVLKLFDAKVLCAADKQALNCVTRHASSSAAMIAVSPFALLDMAIVLWRNLVMLRQISQCYGIELSYIGRIRLIKSIFKTMLYAGASEIIADAGNYALGAGLTGKLSTRVAQGLGAGVLTTRIGVKAMHACRPLPWIAEKPPGLSQLTSQLLTDLKKVIS